MGKDTAKEFDEFRSVLVDKLRQDDFEEFGPFTTTPTKTSAYKAQTWEIVHCDPTNGGFTVWLPDPTLPDVVGAWIAVKNATTSSNTVTVVSQAGATIDGASSYLVNFVKCFQWFYSDGKQWRQGPCSRPSTGIRPLDARYSPVGCWSFNVPTGTNPVPDLSGNGFNLAIETGTSRGAPLHPSIGGMYFDGATDYFVSGAQAAMQITGELTVLALIMWVDLAAVGASITFFSQGAAGETSDTNVLYQGGIDNLTQFQYFSEHGPGTNDPATAVSTGGRAMPFLFGLTRNLSGQLFYWADGIGSGVPFGTITMPTDGSNTKFRVGCDNNATNFFKGVITSVAVYNKVLTATQMLERYNWAMGGAFGFK